MSDDDCEPSREFSNAVVALLMAKRITSGQAFALMDMERDRRREERTFWYRVKAWWRNHFRPRVPTGENRP